MKKTIEMTNAIVVNTVRALEGMFTSKEESKKYPVSFLWVLEGNRKILMDIFNRIREKEQKINLEYFNDEKSENKGNGEYEIKPEFREDFLKAKNDLFSIKNDVDISMIPLNSIIDLQFTPSDFNTISFMITDEA